MTEIDRKICVVGAGRWGMNHINTLDGLNYLSAIVENNEGRMDEISQKFPKLQIYKDIHEAIKDDFDGFVIATPSQTHFEIAKLLLENKNHILVEKPLSLNIKDAETLVLLADKYQVNLMVGHLLLFHPAIIKIKELIESGEIGKLQYIYSNRLNLGNVRTEENVFWSFAPHDISIFQYLIGDQPEEIIARGGTFLQPHIHDTTITMLKYPKNIVGHIFQNWLHPYKEHRLVIVGSKGMLSFEDSSKDKAIIYYEKGYNIINGELQKRNEGTRRIEYEDAMPLTEELKYFISHLDGSPLSKANGANGVEVIKIMERAIDSLMHNDTMSYKKLSEDGEKLFYVHPTSIVDDNVKIGKNTKIWHYSHIQSGANIGTNCSIGQNVNVGENVKIGNYVKIQNNVSVYEGVELEDYAFCGPSVVFTNVKKPRSEFPKRGSEFYEKTHVKKSVSIGANATILCGVTLGVYSLIGAGAVVTKDVPDHALVFGNPAKIEGWVDMHGDRLMFDNKGISENGDFILENNILRKIDNKVL